MKKTLTMFALFAIVGCGSNANKIFGGNDQTARVNGKSAQDYYNQFTYAALGSCQDRSTVGFRFLGTAANVQIGKNILGRPLYASIILALRSDGQYTGTYEEFTTIDHADGTSEILPAVNTSLSGTWSVDGVNLKIPNVGTGSGLTYNGVEMVTLQAQSANMNPLINGQVMTLVKLTSNISVDGESINEYCDRVAP